MWFESWQLEILWNSCRCRRSTGVLSDLGLHFDHPDVLSRFKMLLAVPATTGEAEESSRSSKQHSSSRSSKQQGSPWRIEVIVVRPLCPDPSVPNVRSVRKCPGLPRVVPLWCPRNPQVSRNNQQCWGSVPRDTGVCVCVSPLYWDISWDRIDWIGVQINNGCG